MVVDDLDVETVGDDLSFLLELVVVGLDVLGETELSGDEDLLSAWELELCSSEGFLCKFNVVWLNSDRHENLSDADSGRLAESLTESTSHTLLESIGTSA